MSLSSYEEFVKGFLKKIVFVSITHKGFGSKEGINRKTFEPNAIIRLK